MSEPDLVQERDPSPPPVPGNPPGVGGSPTWVGVLALLAGAGILAGVFLPFLSASGFDSTLIDGEWSTTAVLVSAALLVIGGLSSFGSRWGGVLAGAAGLTFLGSAVADLSVAVRTVDSFSGTGADVSLGAGFFGWALAAALAVVLAITALTQLGASGRPAWPYLVAAGGVALLAVGVLAPPQGFSFGEVLFSGDGWSDASVAVLLGGLATAALVLALVRSPMAAVFALGVTAPWVASWLVFAFDQRPGGLPIPFPDAPLLAGLAIGLTSFAWVGVLWVGAGAPAAATGAGVGSVGLAAGQVITIVVCGASVLVAAGGAAAATSDDSPGFTSYAGSSDLSASSGGSASSSEEYLTDDPYVDEYADDATSDGSGGSSGFDTGSSGDSFETEVCVEVACEDSGSGSGSGAAVEGYDDDVLTNERCPTGIAADMRQARQGGDAGYLQARYEAGNFVIHVCTGPNGPIYHGQHIETGNLIVLPASGDVYGGFEAVNGDFTYFIDDVSLIIEQGGAFIQEDAVFAYEEY